MSDVWQDPGAIEWVNHVLSDMAPKMRESAFSISIAPISKSGKHKEGDVKYWVELGAAICMNKPIILLVVGNSEPSAKLLSIADEVVRVDDLDSDEGKDRLIDAIQRVETRL